MTNNESKHKAIQGGTLIGQLFLTLNISVNMRINDSANKLAYCFLKFKATKSISIQEISMQTFIYVQSVFCSRHK